MNTSRKTVLAGNWKMNLLLSDTKIYMNKLTQLLKSLVHEINIRLYVPYTNIQTALRYINKEAVEIGAQNCHFESQGAYTGEISTEMLLDLGVTNVIIGHSERRKYFSETDEIINKKFIKALKDNMQVILCVGETSSQRELNLEYSIAEEQIKKAFEGVSDRYLKSVCIAYEPVWAIGTGVNASCLEANEMCGYIRGVIKGMYGEKTANAISILYGGSLNATNALDILKQSDIDGGLIGGVSLKVEDFYSVIEKAVEISKNRGG